MSSLNQHVIRHKIGLLNLATELGNVSKACKVMGLSRDTFYRYQDAVAEGGVDALFGSNRRKPNPKNRVDESTEIAVLAYAMEQPAHGQVRVSNELRRRGIFVSASGVRSIWLRHALSSFKLRLVALEKQVAEKGVVLSEDRWPRWKESRTTMWPMAKSKPLIPAIWARRTRSTWARSRA